ncbi:MAG: Cell division protein ftsA [Parcubacteria group bacterium GW2011_GWC2_49_9]|nr:MAG: Cell division protein ftsA [Parcubacteria group bacterium GW2011_GWA2_48_9]KKW14390.1 MAG: Cell division protein ftsA [Parcubacteria group bacterium GW2011_GWC2_49_9]
MAREEIYTGLDIGSTSIRVAMGQPDPSGVGIQILGAAEAPAEGMNKGSVTSIEDAVSSISHALESVERMTGIPVESAIVGIGGTHITSQESHGVVAVSKADGEIKEEDIERVIEAAQAVATPPNYEILHVLPRTFTVDSQKGIKDPVGMTGIRLEVDAQIIQGLSAQVKNMTKCIYRTGVDISDVVVGMLAAAEAVVTKRQKDLGVALVNIGGATTSLLVFEEGDVLHSAILPVGAAHITNDIAIGLRTSIDLAEKIKVEYGTAVPGDIPKREEIHLSELDENESSVVERKQVAEIIEARCEEIFKMVEKELVKIERSGLLPAGVVLCGGGAKLPGLVEVAKKEFRLPAFVSGPQNIAHTPVEKVKDPAWATAVGLVVWGASMAGKGGAGVSMPRFSSVTEVTGKMKKWFKSLIP